MSPIAAASPKPSRIIYVILLGIFVFLYLLPLGFRPVIVPDETRYAEIPREMIASGDWVTPRLNGIRYFEKPVMAYWTNALSMLAFGQNAWAMRLPAALAAAAAGLMIMILTGRFGGGPWTGIWAAAVFITSLEVYGLGVFNVPDGLLAAFITAAMTCFYYASQEERPGMKRLYLALFGAFSGAAFLTKGFLAFAVPVAAIVPFMIWEKRFKELFLICWLPILTALLTALPWSLMIYLRESDFWPYFFWVEHINRFRSDHPQHPQPFWYFLPILAGGALPWTWLAPAWCRGLKQMGLKDSFLRYALCWLVFPFLFFSSSAGKLGTYILPCFAPLSILIALGLTGYASSGRRKAFRGGAMAAGLVAVTLAVGLVISQQKDWFDLKVFASDEFWKWWLGAASLAIWAWLALWSSREKDLGKGLVLFGIAPMIFMFTAHFIIPEYSRVDKAPGDFFLENRASINKTAPVLTDCDAVSAVCWFFKRDDLFLLDDGGELTYGLKYPDSRARLLTGDQLAGWLNRYSGAKPPAIVTTLGFYRERVEPRVRATRFSSQDGFAIGLF